MYLCTRMLYLVVNISTIISQDNWRSMGEQALCKLSAVVAGGETGQGNVARQQTQAQTLSRSVLSRHWWGLLPGNSLVTNLNPAPAAPPYSWLLHFKAIGFQISQNIILMIKLFYIFYFTSKTFKFLSQSNSFQNQILETWAKWGKMFKIYSTSWKNLKTLPWRRVKEINKRKTQPWDSWKTIYLKSNLYGWDTS